MNPIPVHHRVLYLSMNAPVDRSQIPQEWWDAFKYTRAVKSARVNGFFHIPNGFFRVRVNERNVKEARYNFGGWASSILQRDARDGGVIVVPVPSKDAVIGNTEATRHSDMIADAFANITDKPMVLDVLRFSEKLTKASEGGPRSPEALQPKLRIVGELPKKPIVLLDDVLTNGGHLRAARRLLTEAGHTVVYGLACGHTVHAVDSAPWASGTINLQY